MSMLIESSYKCLECVLFNGSTLDHWYLTDDGHWSRTATISSKATGHGCLIQSLPRGSAVHGDFQVVVLEGSNLVQYWRDNSDSKQPWYRGPVVTSSATGYGPASMIQGNSGNQSSPNFELVVLQGDGLFHYFCDNKNDPGTWKQTTAVTTEATDNGSLILANDGYLHCVVLTGRELVHYKRPGTSTWEVSENVAKDCAIPSLIQTSSGALALVSDWGDAVSYRSNDPPSHDWPEKSLVLNYPQGPNALIQSEYQIQPGNFEVITMTGEYQYVHIYGSPPAAPMWILRQTINTN